MHFHLIRKIFCSLLILLVISAIAYAIIHSISDKANTSGKELSAADENRITAQYGLNKPLHDQLSGTLRDRLVFDFGISFANVRLKSIHFAAIAVLAGLVIVICFIIFFRRRR